MSRVGKIARLPRAVREKLNRRLADGEPGDSLLLWLHGLPAVRKTLARHFGGTAVTKQNLSEWRAGGFLEWQSRQDMLVQMPELVTSEKQEPRTCEGSGDLVTPRAATAAGNPASESVAQSSLVQASPAKIPRCKETWTNLCN